MKTDTSHSVLPLLYLSGARTWEMPQLPGLGKLPPRATLVPFPRASDALTLDRNHSPWFLSLNGAWQFNLKSKPDQVTWDAVRAEGWSPIVVPGRRERPSHYPGRGPYPCRL